MSDSDLWAVHVQGPDDIFAMPSRAAADAYAADVNAAYEQFKARPDASKYDASWHAEVIAWDGTPAEHAEEVTRLAADPEFARVTGIQTAAAAAHQDGDDAGYQEGERDAPPAASASPLADDSGPARGTDTSEPSGATGGAEEFDDDELLAAYRYGGIRAVDTVPFRTGGLRGVAGLVGSWYRAELDRLRARLGGARAAREHLKGLLAEERDHLRLARNDCAAAHAALSDERAAHEIARDKLLARDDLYEAARRERDHYRAELDQLRTGPDDWRNAAYAERKRADKAVALAEDLARLDRGNFDDPYDEAMLRRDVAALLAELRTATEEAQS